MAVVEGPKSDGVPDRQHYGRMKLLQFRENYRPAYWGTWSKKSPHISPRYPLRQDKVRLPSFSDHDPSSFSLYVLVSDILLSLTLPYPICQVVP